MKAEILSTSLLPCRICNDLAHTLSLSTPEMLYADLMEARQERENDYRGRSGREALAEMDYIIEAVEADANEKAV